MYLCKGCQRMFYATMEHYVEGDYYPEPFDRPGSVCVGGDYWADVCPYCESEDYEEIEFDGTCPHCLADLPNITKVVFKDYVHFKCPKCQYEFDVDEYGNLEEDNGKN